MKVIILSAATGRGHMSAANTLKDYLTAKNISAEVINALEYISPILDKTVNETYIYLANKIPKVWKMVYESSNRKTGNRIVFGINSFISKRLLPLIEEKSPDVIITTHPFAMEMVSRLKYKNIINIPLVCIITDYAPHRAWINKEVDAYVVANNEMIDSMEKMGIDPKVVYPFGIPVDDSFHMRHDRDKIFEEIGIDKNLPTILIMAGSFGFGNIAEVYKNLQKIDLDFQIVIITGKNKKSFENIKNLVENTLPKKHRALAKLSKYISGLKPKKLIKKFKLKKLFSRKIEINEKIYKKPIKIIYFTNEVDKYMQAADLIITKPGGLTVSEALACGLPIAIFDAIPGQEEENANFLISSNMAVKLEKGADGISTIKNLLSNPKKLDNMKLSCENFDKSSSLENINELIIKLAKR